MFKPTYTYGIRGCQFAILKWTYGPKGDSAICIAYYQTKEEAIKAVRILNK